MGNCTSRLYNEEGYKSRNYYQRKVSLFPDSEYNFRILLKTFKFCSQSAVSAAVRAMVMTFM